MVALPTSRLYALLTLSILLYQLSLTNALLFDSGEQPPSQASASVTSSNGKRPDRLKPPPASYDSSLVLPSEDRLSIPRGCRRSSDFLHQVCQASWAADPNQSPSSWAVHGDLLICHLPSSEPLFKPEPPDAPRTRTMAISGTITFPDQVDDSIKNAAHLDRIDDGSEAQQPPYDVPNPVPEYPQPGAEGFWRQRNGQHEWHPSESEPILDPLDDKPDLKQVKPSSSNAVPISSSYQGTSTPEIHDSAHIKAYDAWSAKHEGNGFLSFSEWKEKYVHVRQSNKTKKGKKTKATTSQSHPQVTTTTHQAQYTSDSSHHPHTANVAPMPPQHTAQRPLQEGNGSSQTSTGTEHPTQISASSLGHRPGSVASQSTSQVGSAGSQVQISPASVAKDASSVDTQPSDLPGPLALHERAKRAIDMSSQLAALKHRWNFASFDCAAVVHRTNPSAKFVSAILSEKKDRYMLSPCPSTNSRKKGEGQFVIVELCDDIIIDTIVLANYEFFSSMFKRFRVRAASQLKGRDDDWVDLGTFRARNMRGLQSFGIPPSSAGFFRYIRIDFLEHYGSEFYCPVSLLRVYGMTQIDEYYKGQRDEADNLLDASDAAKEELDADEDEPLVDDAPKEAPSPLPSVDTTTTGASPLGDVTVRDEDIWRKHEQLFRERLEHESSSRVLNVEPPSTLGGGEAVGMTTEPSIIQQPTMTAAASSMQPEVTFRESGARDAQYPPAPTKFSRGTRSDMICLADPFAELAKHEPVCRIAPRSYTAYQGHNLQRSRREHHGIPQTHHRTAQEYAQADGTQLRSRDKASLKSEPPKAPAAGGSAPSDSSFSSGSAPGQAARGSSPPVIPAGGPPGGGSESIYRAITRRLNALEANATLSLHYIEHSGQMLREVFARMEKRQEERMSDMLRALNASNWRQIESLKRRQQVDLQRAIFEFDVHRQQAEAERIALMKEVQILAEEVLLEKRLGIAQLVLLFSLFVFMGMTRGSRAAPFWHSSIAKVGRKPAPRTRPDLVDSAISPKGFTSPSNARPVAKHQNGRSKNRRNRVSSAPKEGQPVKGPTPESQPSFFLR